MRVSLREANSSLNDSKYESFRLRIDWFAEPNESGPVIPFQTGPSIPMQSGSEIISQNFITVQLVDLTLVSGNPRFSVISVFTNFLTHKIIQGNFQDGIS